MKGPYREPSVPRNGLAGPAVVNPAGTVKLSRPWLMLDGTVRRFRPPGKIAQFATLSVTLAAIVAGAVAWRIDSCVTDLLLAQAAARAMDQVQLAVRDHVIAADFEPPYTQARLDDLSARLNPLLMRARQRASGVLRVNVFARDGTIVYSDVASLRGQPVSPALDGPLALALAGSVGAEISALGTVENSGLRSFSDNVLEAYVPLRLNGQVVGAYELYVDSTPTRSTRLVMWITVAAGFGLLVVVLLAAARLVFGAPIDAEAPAAADALAGQAGPAGYPLTRREVEVLRLMATNRSYAQIAADLIVSEETVRTHVRSIFHKLRQTGRADAVAAATEARIL